MSRLGKRYFRTKDLDDASLDKVLGQFTITENFLLSQEVKDNYKECDHEYVRLGPFDLSNGTMKQPKPSYILQVDVCTKCYHQK